LAVALRRDEKLKLNQYRTRLKVETAMKVITGMVGQGFYNRHSAPQWAAIEYALPWLEASLGFMNLPPHSGCDQTRGLWMFGGKEFRSL
jgi:hypothetical protein